MAWSTRHSLTLLVVATGLALPLFLWWRTLPAGAAERPAPWRPEPLQGPPPRKPTPATLPEQRLEPAAAAVLAAALVLHLDPAELPENPGLVLALSGPDGLRLARSLAGPRIELTGLAPGRWRLAVAPGPVGTLAEPLWRHELDLQAGKRHAATLPALDLAVLEGELLLRRDGEGPAPSDLPVRLFTHGGWLETRPDPAGRFRFTRLIPGKGLLIAGGGPAAGLAGACKEVTLAAGETSRVRLEVQKR